MAKQMTKDEVEDLQRTLNAFTKKWLRGVEPLMVDGHKGQSTNSRVMMVKYYLGGGEHRDSSWDSEWARRARHPNDPKYFRDAPKMRPRGRRRRAAQKAHYRASRVLAFVTPGVTTWEGRTVAKAAVFYLNYARAHGWRGGVNSGWRDPLYSVSLCRRMCGANSCPGRCAGLSSNHVGNSPARFAIDVSDYQTFGRIMAQMPADDIPRGLPRIHNALGAQDPVHFSPNGR